MGLPPFSEAEFWNTVLWAPLGQEVFPFLKRKASGDRSVFDRVARIAAASAARGGVRVDRAKLRNLLSQDRLLQALVARDLAELDAASLIFGVLVHDQLGELLRTGLLTR